jgi:hypothetical protein
VAAENGAIPQLTRAHRVVIGMVATGALIIAGIGFAGSYAADRALAIKKGFGNKLEIARATPFKSFDLAAYR